MQVDAVERMNLRQRMKRGAIFGIGADLFLESGSLPSALMIIWLPVSEGFAASRDNGRRGESRRDPLFQDGGTRAGPVPSSGTVMALMFEPMRARLGVVCSTEGMRLAATDTSCWGGNVHVITWAGSTSMKFRPCSGRRRGQWRTGRCLDGEWPGR